VSAGTAAAAEAAEASAREEEVCAAIQGWTVTVGNAVELVVPRPGGGQGREGALEAKGGVDWGALGAAAERLAEAEAAAQAARAAAQAAARAAEHEADRERCGGAGLAQAAKVAARVKSAREAAEPEEPSMWWRLREERRRQVAADDAGFAPKPGGGHGARDSPASALAAVLARNRRESVVTASLPLLS
jgi:hypothetical protein